ATTPALAAPGFPLSALRAAAGMTSLDRRKGEKVVFHRVHSRVRVAHVSFATRPGWCSFAHKGSSCGTRGAVREVIMAKSVLAAAMAAASVFALASCQTPDAGTDAPALQVAEAPAPAPQVIPAHAG